MGPMVDTPNEAKEIVAAAKYPPAGKRGFAVLYVDEHEGDVEGYMRRANEEVAVVVMIETATGLENVEAIAQVPGVDVLWVGHYDLTASLGIPGDFENPTYIEALESIVKACNESRSRGDAARSRLPLHGLRTRPRPAPDRAAGRHLTPSVPHRSSVHACGGRRVKGAAACPSR
jgi:hypothetical protein